MANYNINFSDGREQIKNVDITYIMDYKMNNLDLFIGGIAVLEEIIPKSKVEKVEKVDKDDEQAYNEGKQKFYDNLTAIEISLIKDGKRKICYNSKEGFYLKESKAVNDGEEIHVSVKAMEHKRISDLKANMKHYLKNNYCSTIGDWSNSEIHLMIDEIFNGHQIK